MYRVFFTRQESKMIQEEKKEARRILKEKIKMLSCETKKQFSDTAAGIFLSSDEYKNADIILSFKAMEDEPSTEKITVCAVKDKKQIFLPVIETDSYEMDFYRIDESSDFIKNSFGTLEPHKTETGRFIAENNIGKRIAILVPGRGFSLKGERLGRGKGYYDRYISILEEKASKLNLKIFKAGFCFYTQTQTPFPSEEHDVKMDSVITESGIIVSKS